MRCFTRRHRQHPITCMLQIYRSLHSLLCVSGSSGLLQQDSAIIRSAFPILVSQLCITCQTVKESRYALLCALEFQKQNPTQSPFQPLHHDCISWVSYINGSLLIIGCSFDDSFTIMLIKKARKKEIAALSKPNEVANVSYFYAIVFVCTGSKLPSMY